jgi:hypothetical protein
MKRKKNNLKRTSKPREIRKKKPPKSKRKKRQNLQKRKIKVNKKAKENKTEENKKEGHHLYFQRESAKSKRNEKIGKNELLVKFIKIKYKKNRN